MHELNDVVLCYFGVSRVPKDEGIDFCHAALRAQNTNCSIEQKIVAGDTGHLSFQLSN